ncbi:MAG: PilT/PilU family type 4a pilus ATPase [Dehalococcoidia bacterium]|nr:PilT/PilU family type 4a pilus ATPase [Dehalococcoidia bacterium]
MAGKGPQSQPECSRVAITALSIFELLQRFEEGGAQRVSDLHLKVGDPPTYRIDGRIKQLDCAPLDNRAVEAAAAALLSRDDLRRLREDHSLDGSYTSDKFQFRLNFFYDENGLAVAIRALDLAIPAVEDVGFANQVWRDIITRQQGLVLITGVTGAGKSTTIASLLDRILHERPCHVITLEDPIEYRLHASTGVVSQRDVGRDVPSFERGLRDCLREDPDVIFVGEMRDRESAAWTLTAAETGHLVLSTLHTRDARGTITRLLDMFPPEKQDEVANQLALGLAYVITQKLVPRADGRGRVVAMEILHNDYAVSNLIRTRKLEQLYTQMQTKVRNISGERMMTMERSLALLVARGMVTAAEAEKWANDHQCFVDELRRVRR